MAVEATFSSVIKCLKKDGRGLEKHIHNLNRNLESCRDTLKSLKSEHSSLRINKNKLESKIKNLEKIVNQKDLKISNLRTCLWSFGAIRQLLDRGAIKINLHKNLGQIRTWQPTTKNRYCQNLNSATIQLNLSLQKLNDSNISAVTDLCNFDQILKKASGINNNNTTKTITTTISQLLLAQFFGLWDKQQQQQQQQYLSYSSSSS